MEQDTMLGSSINPSKPKKQFPFIVWLTVLIFGVGIVVTLISEAEAIRQCKETRQNCGKYGLTPEWGLICLQDSDCGSRVCSPTANSLEYYLGGLPSDYDSRLLGPYISGICSGKNGHILTPTKFTDPREAIMRNLKFGNINS